MEIYSSARTNAYIAGESVDDGMDFSSRGPCLPSDIKMTEAEQDRVIEIVVKCQKKLGMKMRLGFLEEQDAEFVLEHNEGY